VPRFDTRLALMRAAEQLFASQGVDRVSLREIAIAAGQRNVSAATYHFGSKRELIEAILERHSVPVQDSWGPALAADTEHKLGLHELIELLVKPMVAKIDGTPGTQEMAKRIAEHGADVPPMVRIMRSTRLAGILFGSIGDYLRLINNGVEIPRQLFVADLVNAMVALAKAEPPAGS
jgi:AcrR family transcriptional regulator